MDSTIATLPAPEPPAAVAESTPPAPIPYSWDRTQEESRLKQTPFPPTPLNAKKLPIGPTLQYWNTLPLPLQPHAVLYVQRWLPVTKPRIRIDDMGRKHVEHPSCAKYYSEHGALTEDLLVSKLGYGDYSFRLNDSRIALKGNPNAATVLYSELKTKRDWSEHPPVLMQISTSGEMEPAELDMDDPANSGYIAWARSRGLIPNETQQESEDMQNANAGVTERLTSTVERLTDKVIAQAENKEKSQPAPVVPVPVQPPASNGDGGSIRAMADVVTAVLNRPQPPIAPVADPMSMVRGLVDIFKEVRPEKDTSSTDLAKQVVAQAEAANTRIYQLQKDQMDQIRQELKDAKTAAAAPGTATPAPTEVEILEKEVKKKHLLKQLYGNPSEEEAGKPSTMDKWLEAAPHIAPIAQTLIQSVSQAFQYGLQTWQIISYNNALVRNGTTPQPPMTMNQNQQQQPAAQPGQPAPAQTPPLTVEQQQSQLKLMIMLKAMEEEADPILIAFNKGESGNAADSGAMYANNVIDHKGRSSYDLIRSLGQNDKGLFEEGEDGQRRNFDRFLKAIRFLLNHQGRGPNTAHLALAVNSKPSFAEFLAGFFNYDLIQAEMQRQAESGDQ